MKNLLVVISLLMFFNSFSQNQNLRVTNVKDKYENIFYRSPGFNNGKELPFKVNRIVFSTSFKGSKTENKYQISVYGVTGNKKEEIHYNTGSVEELEYYNEVFNGKYKKILLFEYDYTISSKTYTDTSISVEF